jgi:hypothetical protein
VILAAVRVGVLDLDGAVRQRGDEGAPAWLWAAGMMMKVSAERLSPPIRLMSWAWSGSSM